MMKTLCPTLAAIGLLALAGAAHAKSSPRDLGGSWTNISLTTLERPPWFKHLTLPPRQAAEYEATMNDPAKAEAYYFAFLKKTGQPMPPDVGDIRSEYFDKDLRLARIDRVARTSWLTYPRNGQLPYTKAAAARLKAARKRENREFDNPEARPVEERCVLGVGDPAGPPFNTAPYNANYLIVQTRDAVAIETEMNHDVRIIRLNAPHAPAQIRPWMGDSVGRWQGDTLRVETVNFHPGHDLTRTAGQSFILSDRARVTEWFTRVSPTAIRYRFEVRDPATYKTPWRGEMLLGATTAPVMEFACHEGNYSLRGILAGARKVEHEGGKPEFLDGGDPPAKPKKKG